MLRCNEHKKTHSDYHLVAVELPFIPKVIDCMHQTIKTYLEREHAICCLLPTRCMFTKLSRCRSLCKRWESFFVKPGVNVNGQY